MEEITVSYDQKPILKIFNDIRKKVNEQMFVNG